MFIIYFLIRLLSFHLSGPLVPFYTNCFTSSSLSSSLISFTPTLFSSVTPPSISSRNVSSSSVSSFISTGKKNRTVSLTRRETSFARRHRVKPRTDKPRGSLYKITSITSVEFSFTSLRSSINLNASLILRHNRRLSRLYFAPPSQQMVFSAVLLHLLIPDHLFYIIN